MYKINLLIICLLIFSPSMSFSQVLDFDEGIEYIANKIISRAEKRTKIDSKIAVVGIVEVTTGKPLLISSKIEEDLLNEMSNSDHFFLLERRRIEDVIKQEIGVQHTDFFYDQDNAKEVGKIVAADYIVTGDFDLNESNSILNLRIKLIDVEKGFRLGSSNVEIRTEKIKHLLKPMLSKKKMK